MSRAREVGSLESVRARARPLPQDLLASVAVFLVALPLCLGIALASGAPLFSGLLAGIVGGLVIGFISDSRLSVSGPAAGLTVIVLGFIHELGSFEAFMVSVVLAGLLQIALGAVKGGNIGEYFPSAVIQGMLAAIGIILILKQSTLLLGFASVETLRDVVRVEDFIAVIHPGMASIGVLSLATLFLWQWLSQRGYAISRTIPGGLVVVALGIGLNEFFASALPSLELGKDALVHLDFAGGAGAFLAKLSFPDWSALQNPVTYKAALTIAVIASLESLLALDAVDSMDTTQTQASSKNREMVGQGVGNTLCGLLGGLPVTAVIVRSSANVAAGAKTRASGILHSVWLLLCVVLIPQLLEKIPLSALAAILVFVGLKLTPPSLYRKMLAHGREQFLPCLGTVVVAVVFDLLTGVALGMATSIFFLIRSNINSSVLLTSEKNRYVIRFIKDTSFLNKPLLKSMLASIPNRSHVVFDCAALVNVDRDIILLFENFLSDCRVRHIRVQFKSDELKNAVLSKLQTAAL